MTEPTTEAGRTAVAEYDLPPTLAIAIEAEARGDALREVRARVADEVYDGGDDRGPLMVVDYEVLCAILDPEPGP